MALLMIWKTIPNNLESFETQACSLLTRFVFLHFVEVSWMIFTDLTDMAGDPWMQHMTVTGLLK
jgi:hypothetical protein